MQYADIIVDISNENLDKTYQYQIPVELYEQAVIGAPVLIPFGRGNRRIKGYIVGLSNQPKLEADLIKPIVTIETRELAIEHHLVALAAWIKEHYGATMNEALRTVIPVKKRVREVEKRMVVLNVADKEAIRILEEAKLKKNYVARVRLLTELIPARAMDFDVIIQKLNISRATIDSLVKINVIRIESERRYRNPVAVAERTNKRHSLNIEQQQIVDQITNDYMNGIRKNYLIHGVTGSGKTEVYLDIIEQVILTGKQVILLIPEIALTFQTVKRFYERFGDRISILNSRMSHGERYDQSVRAKNGEIDIMIGPRSALFTPFQKLGLIIIDEEHEASYKSDKPPKYHARETAVERARMLNASVILGSATPSLEAYYRCGTKKYKLFELKSRAKDARLPSVEIVDLREELKNGNKTIFSEKLKAYMNDRLEKKEQMMLFLNRRGYAGFISCRSCGHAMRCPHCDISLTSHKDGRLVCHYCGYEEPIPSICPVCGSKYIASFGTGTQKVEEMVRGVFPNARVLRMDADTTKSKDGHEEILSKFANHEADILIGTQMIVKGHDFPLVTLVGILAADLSLNAGDYRAAERTFQLLAQAAGRAGRGNKPGEVVIQTYLPEHYSIVNAAKEDYISFYQQEMSFRSLLSYPPVFHMLVVLVLSKNETKSGQAAWLLAEAALDWLKNNSFDDSTNIIGPAPASLTKANDIYRRVIYIKQKHYDVLIQIKNFLEEYILFSNQFSGCNIQFDFDPANGY